MILKSVITYSICCASDVFKLWIFFTSIYNIIIELLFTHKNLFIFLKFLINSCPSKFIFILIRSWNFLEKYSWQVQLLNRFYSILIPSIIPSKPSIVSPFVCMYVFRCFSSDNSSNFRSIKARFFLNERYRYWEALIRFWGQSGL